MAAIPGTDRERKIAARLVWLPVLAGLLVLYVPTFLDLADWLWQQDEHAHGPIIFAVVVWLIWRGRAALFDMDDRPAVGLGLALAVLSLLIYMIGRSQQVAIFEVGSLGPLLAGLLLSMRGFRALRVLWFPILFVAFMVPLPGIFVDSLTGPLKQTVSEVTVWLLRLAAYPVARDGVIITVGQYQLLVADACSGMNSMFSLSALGLLFTYLTARTSILHNAIVLASVLPIAFAANIVRVLALILITYHFGDEAGQGFLHGAAGMVLLVVSLTILIAVDGALARIITPGKPAWPRQSGS